MARDRLAAMRAAQGGRTPEPSYPTQPSNGGYGGRAPNPYDQRDDSAGRYEMADINGGGGGNYGGADDMTNFYNEISSIKDSMRTYNDNVARISDLHSRSLNTMDENAQHRNQQSLQELVDETSALSSVLQRRIKTLERQGGSGRDGQAKKQQINLVKSQFMEAIQNYQQVEQQYRSKYKQRMERQFKIVKPDASPDEVRAVVNDEGSGQIFSQALLSSNRYGESRAAYREVQERHEDIKKIEKTLAELAQLFNDMSILVEQQDETINAIETAAGGVEKDTEMGLQHTERAVVSARAARKKRWICFGIIIILIIIVVIIVVVVIKPKIGGGGGNKSNNNAAPASSSAAPAPTSSAAASSASPSATAT